jgi:hypothetical protein
MERSTKQRFLEQERLIPNYESGQRNSSDLLRLISAVASVAFMGLLMHAMVVAYLSKPSAKREGPRAGNLRVLGPQETATTTR